MIKKENNIDGVVNDSFGWRNKSQILLYNQNNPFDYTELTNYFLNLNNTGLRNQTIVTLDSVVEALNDTSLSEHNLNAAEKLYNDICEIRKLTDKVGLYAQNVQYENTASHWHFDKNERAILAKYNGAATQIARPEDVLGHEGNTSPYSSLVLCKVAHNAQPLEIESGSIFSITGTSKLLGNPTAHRKAPLDGEPSLILIAEP